MEFIAFIIIKLYFGGFSGHWLEKIGQMRFPLPKIECSIVFCTHQDFTSCKKSEKLIANCMKMR